MTIDRNQLEKIISSFPERQRGALATAIPLVTQALSDEGILTPDILAYALATIQHETANTFSPIEEIGGRSRARKLGYSGGENYFGRGYIQLTHDYNYRKYGERLGLGDALVKNPQLALDPEISAKILAAYMKDSGVAEAVENGNLSDARRKVQGYGAATTKTIPTVNSYYKQFKNSIGDKVQEDQGEVLGQKDNADIWKMLEERESFSSPTAAASAKLATPKPASPQFSISRQVLTPTAPQATIPSPQVASASIERGQPMTRPGVGPQLSFQQPWKAQPSPSPKPMMVTPAPMSQAPAQVNQSVLPMTMAPARPATTYTVKYGDTLSQIAKDKLGDASRYREITGYSSGNPSLIRPGEVLKIPSPSSIRRS